jgi:ABC-2 type transport system permease protein
VTGLGILMLGVPPGGEEVARGLVFLICSVAYGSVWLALAIAASVLFRSPATAALSSLALWLVLAFFWQIIVSLAAPVLSLADPYDPLGQLRTVEMGLVLGRLSPNTLFAEISMALLNPATRVLGPVFVGQLHGAVMGAPLPFAQSALLVWPQITALLAAVVVLFTAAYVLFQRQEVRA